MERIIIIIAGIISIIFVFGPLWYRRMSRSQMLGWAEGFLEIALKFKQQKERKKNEKEN